VQPERCNEVTGSGASAALTQGTAVQRDVGMRTG